MHTRLFVIVLVWIAAVSASAQITNGDFATSIAGWSTASTGPSISHHPTVGNPGGSAYFYGTGGGGNASMQQSFVCGSTHGDGTCAVALEYRYYLSSGAGVQVVVEIDNVVVQTANHTTESPLWNAVSLSVPCGPHDIRISVNTLTMGTFGQWSVFLDNVAAECTLPVPNQMQEWGTLKAIYR